jgi:formylglycine-generating enzyme required for sulfatase activity
VAYCAWLSRIIGKEYRLPSEAEWEYAARAGATTPFWWGASISTYDANYDGSYVYAGGQVGQYRKATAAVYDFKANPWGLYQVHGNVWEWCADNWHENYRGAPEDGSAWQGGDATLRVLRGGAWCDAPGWLRSAERYGYFERFWSGGFRLARTL